MANKYSLKAKLAKRIYSKIQQNKKRKQYLKYFKFNENIDLLCVYKNSRKWILTNTVENKGIRPTVDINGTLNNIAYPEVSGYYIPSLLKFGFRDLAKQYASWLLSIQHENGAWHDYLDKAPYVFDTGQIIKGLIAIYPIMPEVKDSIIRACDYIISQIHDDGRLPTPSDDFWPENICTELIHLYCLSALVDAGELFNRPEYKTAAYKVLEYYKKNNLEQILDFHTLSHFYAYMVEALVDLGEIELAKTAMDKIAKIQKKNGFIPAYKGVNWTCSTGLFQFALIWYKLGEKTKADLTFDYACSLQTKNGGWLGSYGKGANYAQYKEISWAVKYFLDALSLKISSHFAKTVDKNVPKMGGTYPLSDYISDNDGRLKLIIEKVESCLNPNEKMLDVGCGLGRILKKIAAKRNDLDIYGVDITKEIVEKLPKGISGKIGSLLQIPFEDNFSSFTMTTEALEHALDIENAVKELVRVTKKGGKVLIIDKDIKAKGALETPPWEQWFDKEELKNIMTKQGLKVEIIENIPYGSNNCANGLYVAWFGEKL